MDDLLKTVRFNSLLSVYGDLLSKTQKEILTDYYDFNLSISEIASNRGVSRAAVEDAIKKGESKLEDFESKLKITEKNQEILKIIEELKSDKTDEKQNELLSKIERIIK